MLLLLKILCMKNRHCLLVFSTQPKLFYLILNHNLFMGLLNMYNRNCIYIPESVSWHTNIVKRGLTALKMENIYRITINHLHISNYDSKMMFYRNYFPFKAEQRVPSHAKLNEYNIFFQKICSKCKCCNNWWIFYLL